MVVRPSLAIYFKEHSNLLTDSNPSNADPCALEASKSRAIALNPYTPKVRACPSLRFGKPQARASSNFQKFKGLPENAVDYINLELLP